VPDPNVLSGASKKFGWWASAAEPSVATAPTHWLSFETSGWVKTLPRVPWDRRGDDRLRLYCIGLPGGGHTWSEEETCQRHRAWGALKAFRVLAGLAIGSSNSLPAGAQGRALTVCEFATW